MLLWLITDPCHLSESESDSSHGRCSERCRARSFWSSVHFVGSLELSFWNCRVEDVSRRLLNRFCFFLFSLCYSTIFHYLLFMMLFSPLILCSREMWILINLICCLICMVTLSFPPARDKWSISYRIVLFVFVSCAVILYPVVSFGVVSYAVCRIPEVVGVRLQIR